MNFVCKEIHPMSTRVLISFILLRSVRVCGEGGGGGATKKNVFILMKDINS